MGLIFGRRNNCSFNDNTVYLPPAEQSRDTDRIRPDMATFTVRSKAETFTVGARGNTAFYVTPSACDSREVHIRYHGTANPDIRVRYTGYDEKTGEYIHEVSFDRRTIDSLYTNVDGKEAFVPNTIQSRANKPQQAEEKVKPALPPETAQELEKLKAENARLKEEKAELTKQLEAMTKKFAAMEDRISKLEKPVAEGQKKDNPAAAQAPAQNVTSRSADTKQGSAAAKPSSDKAPPPSSSPATSAEPAKAEQPPQTNQKKPEQAAPPPQPEQKKPEQAPAPAPEQKKPEQAKPAEQTKQIREYDDAVLQSKVGRLKAAMPDKWGTDKDAVWETLDGVTGADMARLKELYKATVGKSLDDEISSEMDGSHYAYSMALASGDRPTQLAGKIYYAMEWNVFPFGSTDEDMIASALDSAKSEGITFSQIGSAYNTRKCGSKTLQEWYGCSFIDSLKAELSESDYKTYVSQHIDTSK